MSIAGRQSPRLLLTITMCTVISQNKSVKQAIQVLTFRVTRFEPHLTTGDTALNRSIEFKITNSTKLLKLQLTILPVTTKLNLMLCKKILVQQGTNLQIRWATSSRTLTNPLLTVVHRGNSTIPTLGLNG